MRIGCSGSLIVLLFLLPFGIAFAPTFFPDVLTLYEPFICNDNETLITKTRGYSDSSGSGTSYNFYCRDLERQERRVDGQYFLFVCGASLLPFVLIAVVGGILLRGFLRPMKDLSNLDLQGVTGFYSGSSPKVIVQTQTYDLNDPDLKQKITQMKTTFGTGKMPDDLMETLNAVSSAFTKGDFETIDMTPDSLTEKLRELKEALDSGLITQSEYERKRQDVLDRFK